MACLFNSFRGWLVQLHCCVSGRTGGGRRRQCSSGLQAIADVAAAISAGYYTIGIGAGVETMSQNPMAWEGGVNPRVADCPSAQSCLLPMGAAPALWTLIHSTGDSETGVHVPLSSRVLPTSSVSPCAAGITICCVRSKGISTCPVRGVYLPLSACFRPPPGPCDVAGRTAGEFLWRSCMLSSGGVV